MNSLMICVLFVLSLLPSYFAYGKSYSLTDNLGTPLEEKLVAIMPYKNGVFIEVGANDGLNQSNTMLFEESYGWTGLLIEPSPGLFPQLCRNRLNSKCFQCALGSFEEDGMYVAGDFDGCLMSSVDGERLKRPGEQVVLMRSLQSILDEVHLSSINFFSLDTEGYELNILKGIDFNKTQFDYLLIEVYKHQYDEIVYFLSSKGYDMISCFTNYNLLTNPGWDGTHNDYLFKRRGL